MVVLVINKKTKFKELAVLGFLLFAFLITVVNFLKSTKYSSNLALQASSSFFWDPTTAVATIEGDATPQTLVDCFPYSNSTWAESRHHNIDDGGSIVREKSGDSNYLTQVLSQTLCHEDSAFVNPPEHWKQGSSDKQITNLEEEHHWMFRLAYLGFHLHQHEPAFQEMEERRQNQAQCHSGSFTSDKFNKTARGNNGPGHSTRYRHEYKCPNTKYLVSNIAAVGMGASIRMGALSTFLAGIAMNRTVVFISDGPKNLNKNATYLSTSWPISGCKDRGDYQCYFLPLSPCVPSIQDLQQAPVLEFSLSNIRDNSQHVQKTGTFKDKNLDNEKVVIMPSGTFLDVLSPDGQARIGRRLQELIQQQIDNKKLEVPKLILQRFENANLLDFKSNGGQNGTSYNQGRSILRPAALLYMLRPNSNFKRDVDAVVKKAVPPDFAWENSFGMPIRASDKCKGESMCLLFEEYMEIVAQQRKKYHGTNSSTTISDLVLSSESSNMMATRHQWEKNQSSFPFRFVVNADDIQQGSGAPRTYGKGAYDVMLSSIAVLKLQLLSKHLVGNCCSSFHQMMMDIVKTGCGARSSPTFHCMQELEDTKFHLCCMWSKGQSCQMEFSAYWKRVKELGVKRFE